VVSVYELLVSGEQCGAAKEGADGEELAHDEQGWFAQAILRHKCRKNVAFFIQLIASVTFLLLALAKYIDCLGPS